MGLYLIGAFAGMAVLMVIAGLYGVLAQLVSYRRREFGIRLALGATPGGIVGMVLRQGLISVALAIAGSAVVLLADWLAIREGVRFADRLLPLGVIAIFMIGAILQQCTLPLAYYLRAFKREPFMWLSIVISIVQATAIIVLGRLFGVVGFAIAYAGSAIFLSVPGAYLIFYYRRREWTRALSMYILTNGTDDKEERRRL